MSDVPPSEIGMKRLGAEMRRSSLEERTEKDVKVKKDSESPPAKKVKPGSQPTSPRDPVSTVLSEGVSQNEGDAIKKDQKKLVTVAVDEEGAAQITEKEPTEKEPTEKEPTEKVAAEKVAAEKVAAEKVAAEKVAAEKVAAEKVAAEK
eukprot:300200_1